VWYTVTMITLLWAVFLSMGLWLLFPKGFKFVVGSMVGSFGAMFFWGLFTLFWCMVAHIPTWAFMGWTMIVFLVIGNVAGLVFAVKG